VAPHPHIKILLPLSKVSVISLYMGSNSGTLLFKIEIVFKSKVLTISIAFPISEWQKSDNPNVSGAGYSVNNTPSLKSWAILRKSSAYCFDS